MGQINNFYFFYFLLLRGYHRLALLQIMQLNLSISDINDISKHLTVNIYAFGNQFFNSSNRKKHISQHISRLTILLSMKACVSALMN